MNNGIVPLSQLANDEQGVLSELHGGSGFISRLATLGFTPGTPLTMVQNYGHGPVIVRVRDARIALGRGEAEKILVKRSAQHG